MPRILFYEITVFNKVLIILFIGFIALIIFEGGFYLGFLKGPTIVNNTLNSESILKPVKALLISQDNTLSQEEKIYKQNLLVSRNLQDNVPASLFQKVTTQINFKGKVTGPVTKVNTNVNSFVLSAFNSDASYRLFLTQNGGQEVYIFKKTGEKGNPVETTIAEIKNGLIVEVAISFDILSTKPTLYNLTIIE